MRQAISTKFHCPTNVKGSRYSATSGSGIRIIIDSDQSEGIEGNHTRVARKLAEKLNWRGAWVGGGTKEGFCFVCISEITEDTAFTIA